MNQLLFTFVAQEYRAKRSPWHPNDSITNLIQQLKNNGPHLVTGDLGKTYYETDPTLRGEILGRPVFGWAPNAARIEGLMHHCVVIIGAQITTNGKELIFFLDPEDGSSPHDITTQKVYVTSYQRFKSCLTALSGDSGTCADGTPIFDPKNERENNYAMYLPSTPAKP